jgi:hypothetical protein
MIQKASAGMAINDSDPAINVVNREFDSGSSRAK